MRQNNMTYLLHGEDSVASRNRLKALKAIEIADSQPMPQNDSLFINDNIYAIWKDHKLSATQIKELEKKYGQLAVEEFKTDPVVFKFLDSLRPGNEKVFMPLWSQYLKNEQPEVAFVMLVRQFRLMLDWQNPDLQPWQKNKIRNQADSFGAENLKSLYKKLLEIDYQIKSGQSAVDLQTSLELLLVSI